MSKFRLPPLGALRAFEAAARHLSFSKAAAELNATPVPIIINDPANRPFESGGLERGSPPRYRQSGHFAWAGLEI
jgi:hypothetical protein